MRGAKDKNRGDYKLETRLLIACLGDMEADVTRSTILESCTMDARWEGTCEMRQQQMSPSRVQSP